MPLPVYPARHMQVKELTSQLQRVRDEKEYEITQKKVASNQYRSEARVKNLLKADNEYLRAEAREAKDRAAKAEAELEKLIAEGKNEQADYIEPARSITLRQKVIDQCILFVVHILDNAGRKIPDKLQKFLNLFCFV